jgi:tRNA(Ile)-lysidine synthase
MLRKGDSVLVGVSAGPDSMALLHILNSLKKELGMDLYVVHLNHMIRKGAAEKDAAFVKTAAEKLNLPVAIGSRDVPGIAKAKKLSIEEAARNERYGLYLSAANRFKADKIALGHTRDDQAETILMRLIRGSGLLGLSAIPPTRRFEDKIIIRPLIGVSKEEIVKFLRERKIAFRRDLTNTQPKYFRNKIRSALLPLLEKEFNREIKKILTETAENLRADYNYLLKIAERKFRKYARYSEDGIRVNLKFLNEDLAIQRMIVREAVRSAKGDLNSVTYGHWEDLKNLLKKKTRWSLDLPGGVCVTRPGNNLVFRKGPSEDKADLGAVSYKLKVPGRTVIPEAGRAIEASFVKRPSAFGTKKSRKEEYFDFDELGLPLLVKFRKSGDRIMPLGMDRYKRLKQLFADEKVPFEKRAAMPLVVSRDKIIWACGVKRSGHAKISDATSRVLKLKVSR